MCFGDGCKKIKEKKDVVSGLKKKCYNKQHERVIVYNQEKSLNEI